MRLIYTPIISIVNNHLIDYPTPTNLNYNWGFGSVAGLCLAIQILTGIFLAMHYTPHINLAFNSIEYIMRDVNSGWFIRYLHANGASMFFLVVYMHIGRGLYFGSYIKSNLALWCSGVIIFILMMATAFMGYVLPWGQMSFWGATVITNLASAIPIVGTPIAEWLWGGFSVDNPTLNRFFSLHYLLPFLILGLVILHLTLLHLAGSTNPLGLTTNLDKKGFYPYFYIKDLLGFLIFFFLFVVIVHFYPNILGHSDNYIEADALVTPLHIVPEWYFLPFYAILRSIPDKLGGVALMGLALIILLLIPFFSKPVSKTFKFKPLSQIFYWLFVCNLLLLMWLGAQPVENPFIFTAQVCTFYYFFYFIIINPFLVFFELLLLKK